MRLNDAVIGVVLVFFAIAVIAYSTTFPSLHGQAYGPSLFPTLIGFGLLACGLVLIVRGILYHRRQMHSTSTSHSEAVNSTEIQGWIQWGDWAKEPAHLINMLLIPVLLIAYILLSGFIGFIPLSILILTVLLYRLGSSLLPSVLIAVSCTVLLQLLFVKILLVPLPPGLLLRWIS